MLAFDSRRCRQRCIILFRTGAPALFELSISLARVVLVAPELHALG